MYYGVSWYPEQKNDREFEHDLKLLKESGINVVRMADFAWSCMEPEEGKYDFGWLDKAIHRLGMEGICCVICTPTASTPAWLVEKHPDILYVDNRGVTRPYGARRHYCYNNPVYREYSRKIAGEIAARYGDNPYVLGFQIDNELAQEGTGRCHCNECKSKFHKWLEKKYDTIDNLNCKTGMVFWGHTYDSFKQINLPLRMIEPGIQEVVANYFDNPSLRLDFERFCSESNIEYQNIQLKEIKKYTDKIITTNSTGTGTNSINYYESYGELDKYSCDAYPDLRSGAVSSFEYAFSRGIKEADPEFWILEFPAGGGHGLWAKEGRLQPYPGAIKQAALHAFASGAGLVAHFQFRAFPYGAEQLNYAILDQDGIPRRRYFELQQAAAEQDKLKSTLAASAIACDAAICFDYDSMWALKIKPVNREFDYVSYCRELYDSLKRNGINADIIPFNAGLDKYKLVIVPAPFVMDEGFKNKLLKYVENGGCVLSTFLTAVKTEYNTGVCESLPAGLTELFGVIVEEVEPVFANSAGDIQMELDNETVVSGGRYWLDVLEPVTAEIVGCFSGTFRKGKAVITKNYYGRGRAWYLGTGLEQQALDRLVRSIAAEAGAERPPFMTGEYLEVIRRRKEASNIYCIFNFKPDSEVIELNAEYEDILNGGKTSGSLEIGPRGYVFIQESE